MFFNIDNNVRQLIRISPNDNFLNMVLVSTYRKESDEWKAVFSDINAYIGKNGLTINKKERDGCTPIGIFGIDFIFGRCENPGTVFPYRKVTGNEYWVDDSLSPYYNTWQEGPCNNRWSSAEYLDIAPYDYSIVISYNTKGKIPFKGSAIFMHVSTGNFTEGCIALDREMLVNIIKWLNPQDNPLIWIGR